MATLQEMQAKRKELQAVNPYASLRDANAELQKTAAPVTPPVTPTAPPVAPVSTPTATPAPISTPKTVTGVDGQVFQYANNPDGSPVTPAPVTPTVSTPAPVAQTEQDINKQLGGFIQTNGINSIQPINPTVSTKPVKSPTTATTPPVDYTTSVGREADVQKNLDSFVANGMDAEKLKIASGYNEASPDKKAMIDATIAKMNQPVDQNSIYNMLATNAPISDRVKASPYYKQADATYKQVQNYKTMTPEQLVTSMTTGSLLPGTDAYNKLIQDPTMSEKVVNARIYAGKPKTDEVLANQSEQILSQNSKVAQFLNDGLISEDEYNQMTNNSDVVAQVKLLQSKQQASNDYNLEWDNAIKKVKADFAGSPFLSNMISDINNGYKAKSDYLQNDVSIATGTLSELKGTATTLFNANLNNYIAYRNAQIGVDTARAKNSLDLQQNQAAFDQQIAQKAQLAKDPQTAIETVMEEYKKLGIPFTQSIQTKLTEYAKSGLPLGSYIDGMIKSIQEKPEYKRYMELKKGQLSDAEKLSLGSQYDLKKLAVNNQYDLSKMSVQNQYDLQKIGINNQNDLNKYLLQNGITSGTGGYINVPRTGNNVGQDTNNPGNIMGDSEAQRNIAIGYGATGFYQSPNGRTYAVFPDMQSGVNASMKDLQSKLYGGSSWVKPDTTLGEFASGWVSGPNAPTNQNAVNNYAKLTGYPAGTKIKDIPIDILAKAVFSNEGVDISKNANIPSTGTSSTISAGNYSSNVKSWGQRVMAGDAKLTDIPASEKGLRTQVAGYMQEMSKGTQNNNIATLQNTLGIIESLENSPGLNNAIGKVGIDLWNQPWFSGSEGADFNSKLSQLTSANFMTGIQGMKGMGALSDAEGSKVSASVSSLSDSNQSESAFKEELKRLKETINNKIKSTQIETGLTFDKNGFPIQEGSDTTAVVTPKNTGATSNGAGTVNFTGANGKSYGY